MERSAVTGDGEMRGLRPAHRRVLADEVADSLRDAIMTGRFGPGQRLIMVPQLILTNFYNSSPRSSSSILAPSFLLEVMSIWYITQNVVA